MSLTIFPNEIILAVAKDLGPKELHRLILGSNKRVKALLTPLLYKFALEDGGRQAMIWAIQNQSFVTGKNLVDNYHVSGDLYPERGAGFSALHWAVRTVQPDFTRLLLDNGADVERVTGNWERREFYDFTHSPYCGVDCKPIHFAAISDCPEILRMLIENGAALHPRMSCAFSDEELEITNTWTPIDAAAHFDSADTVKVLLDHGCDVDHMDGLGDTLLHNAISYDGAETVKVLLEYGADINKRSHDGEEMLPLEHAIVFDKEECIKVLLNYKEQIDNFNEVVKNARRKRTVRRNQRMMEEYGASGMIVDEATGLAFGAIYHHS